MIARKIQIIKDTLSSLNVVLEYAPTYNKKKCFFLLGLMLFSSVFELLSIYAVFPFIAIASNPSIVTSNLVLNWLYTSSGLGSVSLFISLVGVSIVLVLFIGNAIASYTVVSVTKFCFDGAHELSVALFQRQLKQDYESYIQENTNDMQKNTLQEVHRFALGFLVPVLYGVVKLTTTIFILAMLMVVNLEIATILASVFGVTYLFFYAKVKAGLGKWGQRLSVLNAERFKVVGESLRGYKEVQISQNADYFIDKFKQSSVEFNYVEVKNIVTPSLARYILEATSIGGMIFVGIYLVLTTGDFAASMPLLAMYALSGLRLMPAVQQLFSSVTQARFHHESLVIIEQELKKYDNNLNTGLVASTAAPIAIQAAIELEGLSYQYPKTETPVLKNISMKIPVMTTVGIMGKTGSGKSTLIDIIMGFLQAGTGQIKVDGRCITFEELHKMRNAMGYVPQRLFLLDATIAENIAFGEKEQEIDLKWVRQCAQMANIDDFIIGLDAGYNTTVGENGIRLSGGQQQRIAIARALYRKPQLLIFDEATSALDAETESQIIQSLTGLSGKVTIVMVAHRLSTLANCDNVILIDNGQIQAQGTLEQVIASPAYQAIKQLVATTAMAELS